MPHGSLDAFAKDLLRQSGPDLVSWLAGERPLEVRDAPSDLVKAEERRADYVLRAVLPGGRPPHYLHVEVQSEGDPEMNLRMLEYWVWMKRNFRKKEKEPFGVSCFVIYLKA